MKLISILGDSISTYAGYTPKGYSVFYDEKMQSQNGLKSVYDIWWAKVNQALHTYLCVNNSYSGSRVTGKDFPSASSDERIINLRTNMYSPDIILVYIGFNDFGNGVEIYGKGLKRIAGGNPLIFADAYKNMLSKLKREYPQSRIICGTLLRTTIKGNRKWIFPEMYAGKRFEDYNIAIRRISKKQNCYLADMGSLDIRYETLDGSHPTAEGHLTIANAWIKCLFDLKHRGLPI